MGFYNKIRYALVRNFYGYTKEEIDMLRKTISECLKDYDGPELRLALPIDIVEQLIVDEDNNALLDEEIRKHIRYKPSIKNKNNNDEKDFKRIEEEKENLRLLLKDVLESHTAPVLINLDIDKHLLKELIVKEHKIILSDELLAKLDLTGISFDGVDVSNRDFSKLKGVVINPSKVFNKNLSYSIFSGVEFVGSFDGCMINNSDFTGSKNAYIEPSKVWHRDLSGGIYSDVCFHGSLRNCKIDNARFKNATCDVIIIHENDCLIKKKKK